MSCTARSRTTIRWPRAGRASTSGTPPASSISTPPAARRCPASATATRMCWPPCTPSSTSSPTRTRASSPRKSPRSWAKTSSPTAPPGTSHVYFVSGGSEAIEAALKMARQYFVEIGRAGAPALHRPQAELPRQYARRAGRRRQRVAAQAVRAAADRDASRLGLLRVSRAAGRRDAAPVRRAPRPGARGQDPGAGPQDRDRLRRRDRRRRHGRLHPAGRGLLQARARDLRPPRHPADPRRGDVRHGAHRHAARLRAGRHRARPDGDRQGARRRLRADRRRARGRQDRRCVREGLGPLPARPHLSRPSAGLRRRARRAAGDPPRQPAGQRAAPGRAPDASPERALRQPPSRRRRARPRAVPGHRAGGRPRQQGDRSIPGTSCTPASSRRPWRAA